MDSCDFRIEALQKNFANLQIADGFFLRFMDPKIFTPLWMEMTQKVFARGARLAVHELLCEVERCASRDLGGLMGEKRLRLCFGIFHRENFIGWHTGDQLSGEGFYMRNSGVLPEFQGRGLYSGMLAALLPELKSLGFQVISSKHNASNNRVLIPKLRAGFVITGLEISDRFGTLVRLEYFTNPLRRDIIDYRCGLSDMPEAARSALGLTDPNVQGNPVPR